MDPTVLRQLLLGVVPPLLAGMVLVALLWWCGRRGGARAPGAAGAGDAPCGRRGESLGAWGALSVALLVAIGVASMHVLLFGRPALPPVSAFDWLPVAAVVFLITTGLTELIRPRTARRVVTVVAIAGLLAVAGWLSARNLIANSWTTGRTVAEIGALVILGTGFALAVARLGRRPGPLGLFCVMVALGVASQAGILLFFSLKLGQFIGIFAAFTGGAFVAALLLRSVALPRPILLGAGATSAVAIFQAVHFGDAARPHLTALGVALVPYALVAALAGFRVWRERQASSGR